MVRMYRSGVSLRRLRAMHRCGLQTLRRAMELQGFHVPAGPMPRQPTPGETDLLLQGIRSRWNQSRSREARANPDEWAAAFLWADTEGQA